MGAKTWMLVYAEGDARKALANGAPLDREASARLAAALFPKKKLTPIEDGYLSRTNPDKDVVIVGCYPGVSVVAATEFGIDYPSKLPTHFIEQANGRTVYLHAMHSVVDWFAFAVWQRGTLIRALSLSPDSGVMEDIGEHLPFEADYWNGKFPADDPEEEMDEEDGYPFPFHPLDLGEAALKEFFGYQIEGYIDPTMLEPDSVRLLQFKRSR